MAYDGLSNRAKNGKCRICRRVRSTANYLKAVGEVRHGFATGHIWECRDTEQCDKIALSKVNESLNESVETFAIKTALKIGRYNHYVYIA